MLSKNRGRKYLLAPGPSEVPPEVLLEMAVPLVHHRTPQFEEVFAECIERLKKVVGTAHEVVLLASSGTGAMEAAVGNVLEPGDKAVVVRGGKFGERFSELCETYGVEVVNIDVEWGDAVRPEEVEKVLSHHPDVRAVFTTLVETSTGVVTDIAGVGEVVSGSGALLVVDGISGIGGQEFHMDEWKVDVLVGGSQKALMCPPGLAFVALSPAAVERVTAVQRPRYYFDLRAYLGSVKKATTPFTSALTLIKGLNRALGMILEEGMENVWRRHRILARAARAGVQGLGLSLFSRVPADVVTAVTLPEGIDGSAVPRMMRDEYGVTVAGGQGRLKGRICRVAHMGWAGPFDVVVAISALGMVLSRLGYKADVAAAQEAAQQVLKEEL